MMKSSEMLGVRIQRLAVRIATMMAEFLQLVDEFDAQSAFKDDACASTAEWLALRCDVNRMTAREYVRVARALRDLPDLKAAFHAGELSYSKVRALTRVARSEDQQQMLDVAKRSTAAELEMHVRAIRRGRAVTDPTFSHRYRSLRGWIDDDGMGVLYARLAPEDQAEVWRAVRRWRDEAGVSAETDAFNDEPPPHERAHADALVGIVHEWANGRAAAGGQMGGQPDGAASGEDEPTASMAAPAFALIHVDARTGTIHTDNGPQVPAATAERLLCDAVVARVGHRSTTVVDVGRAHRQVPATLRRALLARDGGCVWPGCRNRRFLQAHHIVFWSRGGSTRLENLALNCPPHHRLIHEGGWSLERDATGQIIVRRPDGRVFRGLMPMTA